eukprot:Gb_28793 [translate_table: standard]
MLVKTISEAKDSRVGWESLMKVEDKQQQSEQFKNAGNSTAIQVITSASTTTTTKKMGNRAGNAILAFLPKTQSMVSYPMAPFSPGRDVKRPDLWSKLRSNACRSSYSGPIISIIPKEAIGKKKGHSFESQEPTSPKVSCIGQVKLKKKQTIKKSEEACKDQNRHESQQKAKDRSSLPAQLAEQEIKSAFTPKVSKLKKLLHMGSNNRGHGSQSLNVHTEEPCYPRLGKLKRFSGGREPPALANLFKDVGFSQDDPSPQRPEYEEDLDDEGNNLGASNQLGDYDDYKPALVAHSGSILTTPLPKPAPKDGPSEINLWKRRSVAPPMDLNLKKSYNLEIRNPSTP